MVIDPAKDIADQLREASQLVAKSSLEDIVKPAALATMHAIILRACAAPIEAQAASLELLDATIKLSFKRAYLRAVESGLWPNQKVVDMQTEAHILKVRRFVAQVKENRRKA